MPLQPKPRPGERCELCAELIADEHGHVVDLESRTLMCACRPCYLVFAPEGAGGSRFRAVPDRYVSFPDFAISSAQWDALQIPVGVAFFFMNSSLDHVAAFYPEPGGGDRVVAVARFVGRDRRRQSGSGDAAARCRGVPGAQRGPPVGDGAGGVLPGTDRRLLRAGRRAAQVVEEASTAVREAHAALDAFFDRVRTKARPPQSRRVRTLADEPGLVRGDRRAVEAYAAVPTLMLRLKIIAADGNAGARTRAAQPDHDRAEASSLRVTTRSTV